jgi:NAD-dependent deacetylase sirtuin 2
MGVLAWIKHIFCGPSESAKRDVLGDSTVNFAELDHEQRITTICEGIRDGKYKRIIVLTGAGISTAAGIPDFRSRTGLYELSHVFPHLTSPWAVFDYNFFKQDPHPFYYLVRKMMLRPPTATADGIVADAASPTSSCFASYEPTTTHKFLRLLDEKGVLLRVYTQNVDCMEFAAGLSASRLVQVHGTMGDAYCTKCNKRTSIDVIRDALARPAPTPADAHVPTCPRCAGVVKPKVVLFNEGIPARAFAQAAVDFPRADLLLCMGSTFQVLPFAALIDQVDNLVPRVLINLEKVAHSGGDDPLGSSVKRFTFDGPGSYRDVFVQGACDSTVATMADLIGWRPDLDALTSAGVVDVHFLRGVQQQQHG